MRTNMFALCLVCGTVIATVAILTNAGPLDPPAGPVAPTFKTLNEVEPRVPVTGSTCPGNAECIYRITQPGSYYLTGNITGVSGKHGIQIAAQGVTLDLNGFGMSGVAGSLDGINSFLAEAADCTVKNGLVKNFGEDGVDLHSVSQAHGSRVEDVTSMGNGGSGILAGSDFVIARCTAILNHKAGIVAGGSGTIDACTARSNFEEGILALSNVVVRACTVEYNGKDGLIAYDNVIVDRCASFNNDGYGIFVHENSAVYECIARQNDLGGIKVNSVCTVRGCTAYFNYIGTGAAGILAAGSYSRIEGNNVTGNQIGILVGGNKNQIDSNSMQSNDVSLDVNGTDNIIMRNTATGGTPNYSIVAGNSVSPRVSVTDSDGWAITGANHPWANFGY